MPFCGIFIWYSTYYSKVDLQRWDTSENILKNETSYYQPLHFATLRNYYENEDIREKIDYVDMLRPPYEYGPFYDYSLLHEPRF